MIWLAAIHLGATACMTGIIWFVQVVHYPLMGVVGQDAFVNYERAHTRLTSLVVGPLMMIEAAAAITLLAGPHLAAPALPAAPAPLPVIGIVLLALIWASTFLVQVPLHRRLERGFTPEVWRRLVRTNWLRTLLWTARTLTACGMIVYAERAGT